MSARHDDYEFFQQPRPRRSPSELYPELKARAREMRSNPTEAENIL